MLHFVAILLALISALASADLSGDLTCGNASPVYSAILNGQMLFGAPPALGVFANGAWQSTFVLFRAQPEAGIDALGSYNGTRCTYSYAKSPATPVISLIVATYPRLVFSPTSSLVRFTYVFPNGLQGTAHGDPADSVVSTVALFPAFTAPMAAGQPSNILTWSNDFMQPSYSMTDGLGMAGGPMVYYDANNVQGPAVILSPLDQFLSSSIGNDMGPGMPSCTASQPGCWSAGVSSTFTAIPPGFEGSWILLAEEGVTPLMAAYGALLKSYYAETAQKITDISITGLSYTTDNGGQLTFGCPNQILDQCLLGETAYLKQIHMPIQMLSFQNAPMTARGESAPWCVSEFVPNPRKVPMGMQAFQKAVGLPLQLYLPYLCNTTNYTANYTLLRSNTSLPGCHDFDFYDPAPSSSLEYFGFIMDLVLDYGGTLFEPDFLHQNHLCVDEFIRTIGAAEAVFSGMVTAAQVRGIAIQFCFATPHVILWTLTAPAVTNARVSLDFYYGRSWDIGVSSLMAWAAGSAPSKDTLWSSDNGAQATTRGGCDKTGCPPDHSNNAAILHTMLAVLTTGPVGYSDAPNETDITLVMRTCDAAGNLLQPSRPIVAVDSTHASVGNAPTGFVLMTHTEIYGTSPLPSMYFTVSHHLTSSYTLRGLDVYPRLVPSAPYVVANWSALNTCVNGSSMAACGVVAATGSSTLSAPVATLQPQYDPFLPLLTLIAPVCGGNSGTGLVLYGEVDKVTTISTQRFQAIQCTPGTGIVFTILGQPGEIVRLGYQAAGVVRFLAYSFPASAGGPVSATCTISASSAQCSSAAALSGPAVSTPVAEPRLGFAGSGPAVVAGAMARVATPINPTITGELEPHLPPALATYVQELHRNMSQFKASMQPAPAADLMSDPVLAPLHSMLGEALGRISAEEATQDCMAYALAYEYALRIMPSRAPHREVWDALRLGPGCGATPPPSRESLGIPAPWPPAAGLTLPQDTPTFYVAPSGNDNGSGSQGQPFATIARAVAATRAARAPGTGPAAIILRAGLHVLGQTISLDARDAFLSIANYPGETVFVSGGASIGPLNWVPVNVTANSSNVYSAKLTSVPQHLTSLVLTNATDSSPVKRLYRAQYPNFNPEMHATASCGGGSFAAGRPECVRGAMDSPFIRETAQRMVAKGAHPWLAAGSSEGLQDNVLLDWVPPPHFPTPQLYYRDLLGEGLKNDSILVEYNRFAVGRGGACGLWTNAWSEDNSFGWDYHCGNISQGGWENVDELMYSIGQLNLPYAAVVNTGPSGYPNSAQWKPNLDPTQRENGATVVNVWHTQGWFNNAFYVTGVSQVNSTAIYLNMTADNVYPLGGWQGGRHWETYGSFHGSTPDGPLLGGSWWISNILQELDSFDEFYFDTTTNTLYVFWNASYTASGNPYAPPPANLTLMVPQLEVFFNISGATDITISGLGYRDQVNTMMEPWVVPSGGDWGLRPAGVINIWDSERITISDSLFSRIDSNAVFLGSYNRNVSVLNSEFVWIGMNAVASLGLTEFDDGTAGTQPWGTVMAGLYVHELALVEKQSSVFFSGRTPLARLETSIMFNGPRAMINVNDNFGGGSNFTRNLLFNTCRESGDHGNMNSWSRMPMSSNLTGVVSYMDQMDTETSFSFGIANYGASQAFDNDDGSNHFYTHDNFFYQSDGVKGDYGPHDVTFASNVIVGRAYDGQNCVNSAPYVPGHQHKIYNNTCIIMAARNPWDVDMVIQGAGGWCNPNSGGGLLEIHDNNYYTAHGNASVACGSSQYGTTIAAYRARNALFEQRSTFSTLPTADQVIQWGRDVLGM